MVCIRHPYQTKADTTPLRCRLCAAMVGPGTGRRSVTTGTRTIRTLAFRVVWSHGAVMAIFGLVRKSVMMVATSRLASAIRHARFTQGYAALDPLEVGVALAMQRLAPDLGALRGRNHEPSALLVDRLVDGTLVVGAIRHDLGNRLLDVLEKGRHDRGVGRGRVGELGRLDLSLGVDGDVQLPPSPSTSPAPLRRGPLSLSDNGQAGGIDDQLERAVLGEWL